MCLAETSTPGSMSRVGGEEMGKPKPKKRNTFEAVNVDLLTTTMPPVSKPAPQKQCASIKQVWSRSLSTYSSVFYFTLKFQTNLVPQPEKAKVSEALPLKSPIRTACFFDMFFAG